MAASDALLHWHLSYNHYPPISDAFFGAAREAIVAVNEGRSSTKITLPNGLVKTADAIVNELHLEVLLRP